MLFLLKLMILYTCCNNKDIKGEIMSTDWFDKQDPMHAAIAKLKNAPKIINVSSKLINPNKKDSKSNVKWNDQWKIVTRNEWNGRVSRLLTPFIKLSKNERGLTTVARISMDDSKTGHRYSPFKLEFFREESIKEATSHDDFFEKDPFNLKISKNISKNLIFGYGDNNVNITAIQSLESEVHGGYEYYLPNEFCEFLQNIVYKGLNESHVTFKLQSSNKENSSVVIGKIPVDGLKESLLNYIKSNPKLKSKESNSNDNGR